MMKAFIKNTQTRVVTAVTATTDHPACSYGQALWVDEQGTAYFQIGMVNPLYTEESVDFTSATREELGQLIRGWRVSQGISIRDMAKRASVRPSTVQNVENGAFTPRLDVIQRMFLVLGRNITSDRGFFKP